MTAPARRKSLSLATRAVIFALLVVALSDPRWQAYTKDIHVIWLVDASRSVDGEGARKAAELHKEAGNHGTSESWIVFGERV